MPLRRQGLCSARTTLPGGALSAGRAVGGGHWNYRWERLGRNLIQARTAMATSSSQGENRMCTTAPRMARATMAITTRAMIASIVIGLRSGQAVAFMLQGCRRRWPPSIRISPGYTLVWDPEGLRVIPDPVKDVSLA